MSVMYSVDLTLTAALLGQGPKRGVCAERVVEGFSDPRGYVLSRKDLPFVLYSLNLKWYLHFWAEFRIPSFPNVFLYY